MPIPLHPDVARPVDESAIVTVALRLAAHDAQTTVDDVLGRGRTRALAWHRQVAMWAVRETTEMSYPQIARAFHRSDHTTVMHACKQVVERRDANTLVRRYTDGVIVRLRRLIP